VDSLVNFCYFMALRGLTNLPCVDVNYCFFKLCANIPAMLLFLETHIKNKSESFRDSDRCNIFKHILLSNISTIYFKSLYYINIPN